VTDPQFHAPTDEVAAAAADPEFVARYGPVASAMFTAAQVHAPNKACGASPGEKCPPQTVCVDCQTPTFGDGEPAPDAPPPPAAAPPTPLVAGTYALYEDGVGGVFLVLGQSTGETLRHHIPAGMIKMAERFGPGGGLGKLFGLGG